MKSLFLGLISVIFFAHCDGIVIYVGSGDVNETCFYQDYVTTLYCATLQEALGAFHNFPVSSTVQYGLLIHLPTGNQSVSNTQEEFLSFSPDQRNLIQIRFIGSAGTTIVCADGGFVFSSLNSVIIQDVSFSNCSSDQSSVILRSNEVAYIFKVSLFFSLSSSITFDNVVVETNAETSAVIMLNNTAVSVNNSVFHSLEQNDYSVAARGGGFIVKLQYCPDGTSNCDTNYRFDNTIFTNYVACNNESIYNGYLGKGGGLAVVIAGSIHSGSVSISNCIFDRSSARYGGGLYFAFVENSYQNSVAITDCTIDDNRASHGGGFYLLFMDNSFDNSVTISRTVFTSNEAVHGGGGGIYISFLNSTYQNPVLITNSNIYANSADFGGGMHTAFMNNSFTNSVNLTAVSVINNTCSPAENGPNYGGGGVSVENLAISNGDASPNYVVLSGHFENNKAYLGGAVAVYVNHDVSKVLSIGVFDSCFIGNQATFGFALYAATYAELYSTSAISITQCTFEENVVWHRENLTQSGYGTVYSYQTKIIFSDIIDFVGSKGSALVLVNTAANFSYSCSASFRDNTGIRGGAIALLGNSFITVNTATIMRFEDNMAFDQGGAIYKSYIEQVSVYTPCFIHHQNPNLDPDQWNVSISFSNNRILRRNKMLNAIHSTSILPCNADGKAFRWKGWTYDTDDERIQITTDFHKIKLTMNDDSLSMIPDWPISNFSITLFDELGNNVTADVQSFATETELKNNETTQCHLFSIQASNNLSFLSNATQVSMVSLGNPSMYLSIPVKFQQCPPGFATNSNYYNCTCTPYAYKGIVQCSDSPRMSLLQSSMWIGTVSNTSDEYLAGTCPIHYCSNNKVTTELPFDRLFNSDSICANNREGILCGQCTEGHGPAVNTWSAMCIPCNDTHIFSKVMKYLSALYIPYTVLLTLVIVFGIQLTSLPLSSLVIFSQLVTTTFDISSHKTVDIYPEKSLNFYRFVYGILNLHFLETAIERICFTPQLSPLTEHALNYFLVIYPIIGTVVIVAVVKCTTVFNLRSTRAGQLWKYLQDRNIFKHCPKTSCEFVIAMLTTVVTLTFIKMCLTSSFILKKINLIRVDGSEESQNRAMFAAHLNMYDVEYMLFQSAAVTAELLAVVFSVFMLDYPLRLLEYMIQKVRFLSKIYPKRLVEMFVSTFNKDYKPNYRVFAGLTFFFQYSFTFVYVSKSAMHTKFSLQSLTCSVMLLLFFIFWPYKAAGHNYLQILLVTNLLILNGLEYYQYVNYELSPGNVVSKSFVQVILIVEYFFVLLPLCTLIGWILLKCTKKYHQIVVHHLKENFSALLKKWDHGIHKTFSSAYIDEEGEERQPLFLKNSLTVPSKWETKSKGGACPRDETVSTTCSKRQPKSQTDTVENEFVTSNVPVTIIDVHDKGEGEATAYQANVAEGYFLRTDWNSIQPRFYGSVQKDEPEEDGAEDVEY